MILTRSLKVCLYTAPCDLRKSFDTLSAIVSDELKEDPCSRKLFVFLNKRANRVKILHWDGSGFWILMKRLEQGTFTKPITTAGSLPKLALKPEALDMLLNGIDLKDCLQRPWYQEPAS